MAASLASQSQSQRPRPSPALMGVPASHPVPDPWLPTVLALAGPGLPGVREGEADHAVLTRSGHRKSRQRCSTKSGTGAGRDCYCQLKRVVAEKGPAGLAQLQGVLSGPTAEHRHAAWHLSGLWGTGAEWPQGGSPLCWPAFRLSDLGKST